MQDTLYQRACCNQPTGTLHEPEIGFSPRIPVVDFLFKGRARYLFWLGFKPHQHIVRTQDNRSARPMTTDSTEALHKRRGFAGLKYEPVTVKVHAYLDGRGADGYEFPFRAPQCPAGQAPYDRQLRVTIKALLD